MIDKYRIAIIKADDVSCITPKWDRFFALSRDKGISVSAGIVCSSLKSENVQYKEWLRAHQNSGWVEFWNHGWDHLRWKNAQGQDVCEFKCSGYLYQHQHFHDSQKLMATVLGNAPTTFAPPFNTYDDDTLRIINETPESRLLVCHRLSGELDEGKYAARMLLAGESYGVGKPDFESFKQAYQECLARRPMTYSAIQFHPNMFEEEHFDAYSKIIDFLIKDGWRFMLPSEFIACKDKQR